MYYDDYNDFSSASSIKTIKVYRNGDHSLSFDLKLGSDYKAKDVTELIETKLRMKPVQKLRLFTSEGLELPPEDLSYLKSGVSIFASRGENFDKSSTLAEYDIIRPLGEGGFGEVLLAVNKRTKEQVAIKFLKANSRVMANEVDKLFAEAETLKNLRHKNIVHVINCFSLSSMQVAFVMEYLDGGELLEYVLKRKRLTEEEALEFFRQIAEAVAYCHRNKLIHCDLKLENILLESKTSKVVKVVDFGISGLCTGLQTDANSGSLEYMAPENFNGSSKGVHPGVDVWALGCMLYGMVCGKLPFSDDHDSKIIDKICHGRIEYDEAGKKLSREIKDLIAKMLEVNPEHRVAVYDILDHPWMMGQKLPEIPEEEAKGDKEKKSISQEVSPSSALLKKSSKDAGAKLPAGATKTSSPSTKRVSLLDKSPKMSNSPASLNLVKRASEVKKK